MLRALLVAALAALIPSAARAAELDLPPSGAFTVVVIPDTQGYDGAGTKRTPQSTAPLTNAVFRNHTRWIVEHLRAQNIVFVSHVGDIVDLNNDAQWTLARECLAPLHGAVPYALVVGNHDMVRTGDSALFQKYFPASRFAAFPWYGGTYDHDRPDRTVSRNNANSFQLFSAGGLDFIHLALECNAPDDVLAWAGALLEKYATRRALISTHMDLGVLRRPQTEDGYVNDPTGRMQWVKVHGARGNSPQQMWEKLYSRHANVDFVFSGDQSRITALTVVGQGSVGHTVRALLSDYTSSGPLRLYRFLPAENKVRVITFDTTTRTVVTTSRYVADPQQHNFTLDYPMRR
jgi:hypothetical protein